MLPSTTWKLSRSALSSKGRMPKVSSTTPYILQWNQCSAAPTRDQQQQQQQQQQRWKHSERQVKRLFRNHPAKIRVEKRMGLEQMPLRSLEPIGPRQFEAIFEPQFLPNGWSAPPGPEISIPEYPFFVARTKNKPHDAAGFLPVYSEFRKDGARTTTRVKKVTGDRDLFVKELRSVLELPQPKDPRADAIRIRVGGTIEVKGNRTNEIKTWLAGLGF